jgi:phage/plasmid-like protein (TIGR03299 family)
MGLATYDRKRFFENAGTNFNNQHVSVQDALKLAGLQYDVQKVPVFLEDGSLVPNTYATQKSDDGTVLGVVGKNYGIVQNTEAFDFVEALLSEGAEIETAGYFKDFSKTFITAKADTTQILGDNVDSYLLFTNSFDGSGSVRCMFTPVRVFCSNVLVRAFKQASNKISIRHSTNVMDRLTIAQETFAYNQLYIDALKKESESLALQTVTREQYRQTLIPAVLQEMNLDINDTSKQRNKDRPFEIQHQLLEVYDQDDLQNYNNTAYKAMQAIADFESHYEPARNKDNPQIYMQRVLGGMVLLQAVCTAMNQKLNISFN